jgi:L-alanine-DL-glutamate epimerase-like enolase superfamily enzyme
MSDLLSFARVSRHDLALAKPYSIAGRQVSSAECVLVEVGNALGHTGLGTASPSAAVTGETIDACFAAASEAAELARHWQGDADSLLRSPLFNRLAATPAARAAVEMAIVDLKARTAGVAVAELLGGRHHDRLPTSVTIGIQGASETLEEARRLLAAGFRCLKIKIGNDLDADIRVLELLRRHLGSEPTIRVDPNQGYDRRSLAAFVQATRHLSIELIEQPMPRGSHELLCGLRTPSDPPFAADEDLHSPADAERLAESGGYGVFNIKLMKCGGILPAMEIAAIARRSGVALMWGCMDESVVSIAAALHAAFASPATRYLDLDGSFDLAADIARGGFVLDRGDLLLSDAPGLGASLISGEQ